MSIHVLETTDIHGSYMPYDFILQRPAVGTLSRAATYIHELRGEYGDDVLLFDCGDILQGQPIIYYYNYIVPEEENIAASVTNYLRYDLQTFGNHDIETGHAVYDKWVAETTAPIVCCNLIDVTTGEPYVPPYYIFAREGVRIAVIGGITDATPNWLSEDKWSGLRFDDLVSSAQRWVDYLRDNALADIIIGLFHSGRTGGINNEKYEENCIEHLATTVTGIDAILYGHDHTAHCEAITGADGRELWLLNPANAVHNIAELTIDIVKDGDVVVSTTLSGKLVDVTELPIDTAYETHFTGAIDRVKSYVSEEIGTLTHTLHTSDGFLGASDYMQLIHEVQLAVSGADVSLAAPLQMNATVNAGMIYGADMFNIYKYENLLCTLTLTGEEIRDYLEMSYDLWTATMTTDDDHILLIEPRLTDGETTYAFVHPSFNFDSAYGIDYEVDVTKAVGERVNIISMSDGTPFDETKSYTVAMSSYRANNGGQLLELGAKIAKEDIANRIVWTSEKDLRTYIREYISSQRVINPVTTVNWRFVPTSWTDKAIARDRALLFHK